MKLYKLSSKKLKKKKKKKAHRNQCYKVCIESDPKPFFSLFICIVLQKIKNKKSSGYPGVNVVYSS